jgi:hypothetical protein
MLNFYCSFIVLYVRADFLLSPFLPLSAMSQPGLSSSIGFSRLASVEVQLVLQWLDTLSKVRASCASKQLLAEARTPFAWQDTPPFVRNQAQVYSISAREAGPLLPLARLTLRWDPAIHSVDMDRMYYAPPLFGVDVSAADEDAVNMEELKQLLEYECVRELRELNLPPVREFKKYVGLRGLKMVYEQEVFALVAELAQLRSLSMPHEYSQHQIEPLLQQLPPHLTELHCTVGVWQLLSAVQQQQIRRLHLHDGVFDTKSGAITLGGLADMAGLESLQLSSFSFDPSAQGLPVAGDVFIKLTALHTLTLSTSFQGKEALLQHVHRCPSLRLMCIRWTGEETSSCDVSASAVRDLLQRCPSVRVHFIREASSASSRAIAGSNHPAFPFPPVDHAAEAYGRLSNRVAFLDE